MLADLFQLEAFYGPPSAALYLEDISLRYGIPALNRALAAGEIAARCVIFGPDSGRMAFWLTEKGREVARAY